LKSISDPDMAAGWNNDLNAADAGSIVAGAGESSTGGGMMTGSAAVTAGTGGLSIEITGPTAVLGVL
jgi:hypothetical protein